jgi:hypothetical protein
MAPPTNFSIESLVPVENLPFAIDGQTSSTNKVFIQYKIDPASGLGKLLLRAEILEPDAAQNLAQAIKRLLGAI